MRTPFALCLCLLAVPPLTASAQSDVERLADSVVGPQLSKRQIAGAVVTAVKDGAILFSKGYGDADIAQRRPMTRDTLVRVASITKTLTALAVMRLVQSGELDLDRDVNEYLDFAVPTPPGRAPIALRHLLSHQSGFEDRPGDIGASGIERIPLGPYLARHLPPRLRQRQGVVAYSNYNAALAAYIVERVSGQPFERYLDSHIFQPLQMASTTAVQPVPAQLLARVSSGYIRSDLPSTPVSMATATIFEVGSTGVVSSGDDMGRLMLALLDARPSIVSRAILDAMMTDQAMIPRGTVGLGFYGPLGSGGNPFIGHDGNTGGFQSTLALFPREGFGLFASYNSVGVPARVSATGELLARVAERFFPATGGLPNGNDAVDVSGSYQPARRADSNLFTLRSLLEQVAVRAEGDRLTIRRAILPFGEPLEQIEPGLFRWAGLDVSFSRSEGSTTLRLGSGVAQFLPVPWWASASAVIPTVAISMLIAAGAILAWPVSRVRQRLTQTDALTRRLATIVRLALLSDVVAIGAAWWLVTWGRPLVAISSAPVAPLGLAISVTAWTGVMSTPLAIWHAGRFARRGVGGSLARGREAVLVVVHAILVAFCLYWRIAGTTLAF